MRGTRRSTCVAAALAGAALLIACPSRRGATYAGDAGESDDAGVDAPLLVLPNLNPTPPPALGAVTPSHAFLARHAEILVHGYSTSWSAATTVDLGAGIVVTNLSAPAPDLLAVDFGVAATAAAGARDVTVLDADGGALVAPGALTLDAPIALTFAGTMAQGSIAVAHVTVLDPTIPLDTTSTTNPLGVPTYTNLAPVVPAGLSATVVAATASTADVQLFIDITASGIGDFDLVSGPPGASSDTDFPLPAGVSVAVRTATPLTPGTAASGSVDAAYATGLFVYTPPTTAFSIVDFSATSAASTNDPSVLLLPASGRWTDELTGGAVATWVTSSTDPIYAVYFDATGMTGAYTVGLTTTTPAATAATTPDDGTMAGAVFAPALPFVLTGGLLTTAASEDWIELTLAASETGKQLEVQSAGDPLTFLDVTIYDGQGNSIGGNETGGPVHALTGPLVGGRTYYVAFSPGSGFDPAHGAYEGILRLQ